ncbi:MAG: hypothetical protein ABGZ17_10235, partial [Planctomycetaceae bacterium]
NDRLRIDIASRTTLTDPLPAPRTIYATWLTTAEGEPPTPRIEQFRVSGLMGDDQIEFLDTADAAYKHGDGYRALQVSLLNDRTDDFTAVIDGGPGDDILKGTAARDRIDGGYGSDIIYGLAGDDRLWGDGGPGQGRSSDHDRIFGGQGHDDVFGGQGTNALYAWSTNPDVVQTELGFDGTQSGTRITAAVPLPANGRLSADAILTLQFGTIIPETITLPRSVTLTNTSPQDLVADLNLLFVQHNQPVAAEVDAEHRLVLTSTLTPAVSLLVAPNPFGVFVDETGRLYDTDGDLNADGILDEDAQLSGVQRGPRAVEDTGLNRTIGSTRQDDLYGGTGLDFMFGNGPDNTDRLYNRHGELFTAADAGVAGEEWKQYAQSTDRVWYYGGSNLNDEIHVDYVTEPGVLAGHHVITRLTENNGNFTFDASLNLDFNATDESGGAVWSATDSLFGLSLPAAGVGVPTGQLPGAATFTLRQTVGQQDPTSFPVTVLPDPTNVGLDDLLLDLNRAIQTAAVEA